MTFQSTEVQCLASSDPSSRKASDCHTSAENVQKFMKRSAGSARSFARSSLHRSRSITISCVLRILTVTIKLNQSLCHLVNTKVARLSSRMRFMTPSTGQSSLTARLNDTGTHRLKALKIINIPLCSSHDQTSF